MTAAVPGTGHKGGDYVFGQGLTDFWIDQREAPAQAVLTRLKLLKGEWFIDLDDGTDWATRVLGRNTGSTYDPEIQARIAGTKQVTQIAQYESINHTDTRQLVVRALIDTAYGRVLAEVFL